MLAANSERTSTGDEDVLAHDVFDIGVQVCAKDPSQITPLNPVEQREAPFFDIMNMAMDTTGGSGPGCIRAMMSPGGQNTLRGRSTQSSLLERARRGCGWPS